MTNVKDENRLVPCVLGGCFITGEYVMTDTCVKNCKHFKNFFENNEVGY